MDATRAMLVHAHLPKVFWGPAILTASHVHNICPHPNDPSITPHEFMRRSKPDIRYLRTFGCDVYGFIPHELRNKLDPRARKGTFIGYADHQKGYILFHTDSGVSKVYRSVVFNENGFGNRTEADGLADASEPDDACDTDYLPKSVIAINNEPELEGNDLGDLDHENLDVCLNKRRRKVPNRFGNLIHHSWINLVKESEGTASTTPRTYEEAIACPEAQFWIRAIDEELNNLLDH